MTKLHELLAVEGDLEGIYKKILDETKVNFTKYSDRYFGQRQRVENFDENAPSEADTHKEIDDTVVDKLQHSAEHIIRYLDVVLQKETTNQEAKGDIIVDGVTIATNLPATFLLGLENKLKLIRNSIYTTIPTLQPGVSWVKDESIGDNIYMKEHPDEKFRTKKAMKNHIVSEATKEHPAQVNVYNEDIKTAKVVTNTWCGMISSSNKAVLLGKVDKLIRGVKKARQRANTTEVVKITIGKELFDFINN